MGETRTSTPPQVQDFAEQAVDYVDRALSCRLDYGSETLPILDHYLRSVPSDKVHALELVATTAGAYFGETVRRWLGGRWDLSPGDPNQWRVVLTTGLSFCPAGAAAATITGDDYASIPIGMDVPSVLRTSVEEALQRMGQVSQDEYYSLCGRFDTFEHLHHVILAIAADKQAKQNQQAN